MFSFFDFPCDFFPSQPCLGEGGSGCCFCYSNQSTGDVTFRFYDINAHTGVHRRRPNFPKRATLKQSIDAFDGFWVAFLFFVCVWWIGVIFSCPIFPPQQASERICSCERRFFVGGFYMPAPRGAYSCFCQQTSTKPVTVDAHATTAHATCRTLIDVGCVGGGRVATHTHTQWWELARARMHTGHGSKRERET